MNKLSARQEVIWGQVFIRASDDPAGGLTASLVAGIEVPGNEANPNPPFPLGGATILHGSLVVVTAFNSTTNSVTVGDSANASLYLGATSLKTVGRTALVPTGKVYNAKDIVAAAYTSTGAAPTTGLAILEFAYVVLGRAEFSQGLDVGDGFAVPILNNPPGRN